MDRVTLRAAGNPGAQIPSDRARARMASTHPPTLRSRSLGVALRGCLAVACAAAFVTPAAGQQRFRELTSDRREYTDFLGSLDGSWISFRAGSASLSSLDSLALTDLAVVLAANPELRLRLWASAPDAAVSQASFMGSQTELARRRREAVRAYLVARGVNQGQLRAQTTDPEPLPVESEWRDTGGTFLFVDHEAATLNTPAAWVRVRALPGSEIFFIPRQIADRDSTRVLCRPPSITRRGQARADSILEGSYPPRPIVAVARDATGVIRTRMHDVDPSGNPDLLDFTRELPDQRCH